LCSYHNNTVAKRGAPALIAGYVGEGSLQVTSNCNIKGAPIRWQEVARLNLLALFRRNHDCTTFRGMSGALVFQLQNGGVLRPVGIHHGPGSGDGSATMTSISGHLGSSAKLQSQVYSQSQIESAMSEGGAREDCQQSYGDYLYQNEYKKGLSSSSSRTNNKMLTDWFLKLGDKVQKSLHQEWLSKLAAGEKKVCSKFLSDAVTNPFGNEGCPVDMNGDCAVLSSEIERD
jgi:hypothetical protein